MNVTIEEIESAIDSPAIKAQNGVQVAVEISNLFLSLISFVIFIFIQIHTIHIYLIKK